jgi:hypothetical protein
VRAEGLDSPYHSAYTNPQVSEHRLKPPVLRNGSCSATGVSTVRLCILLWLSLPWGLGAQRINHAGRILGPLPLVTNAVLFNTPESDDVVSRLQIFPPDNAWNEDVSRRPLLTNSAAMMSQIVADLQPSRRGIRAFYEMNFALVPPNQPLVPIVFNLYGDESDPSPYPLPSILPIETWPRDTPSHYTLFDWQRDLYGDGGDRHAIILQPSSGMLWETWQTRLSVVGGQSQWQAANGAKFDLNSNTLRPEGWTSADAAGLSMFAGLVRYDECQRGVVEHALRLVVAKTRRSHIYPATHHASSDTSPNRPAMGQRLRLRSSFVIPPSWSTEEKAVLVALKKYGALVADNGGFCSLSVAPDQRWSSSAFSHLSSVSVTNLEVIQSTGISEGPRSPGTPVVNVGQDRIVRMGTSVSLVAQVNATNTLPLALEWRLYSGPSAVTLTGTNQSTATAVFHALGDYTLMFKADDGVHTPAYDALVVRVTSAAPPPPLNLHVLYVR